MPRKRKSDQPIQTTDSSATTATIEAAPETITDSKPHTLAEQESMPVSDSVPTESAPTFVERFAGRSNRPLLPDPFALALDNEAGVRLFENRQARVMAIKFDEKPAQPVIDLIKEAGFGWNPADRVWTKPVRGDAAMGTRIDAERLYQEVRQMIRQDKGMETALDIPF